MGLHPRTVLAMPLLAQPSCRWRLYVPAVLACTRVLIVAALPQPCSSPSEVGMVMVMVMVMVTVKVKVMVVMVAVVTVEAVAPLPGGGQRLFMLPCVLARWCIHVDPAHVGVA